MALLFWAPLDAANEGLEGHVTIALQLTEHAWIQQMQTPNAGSNQHPTILHNYHEHYEYQNSCESHLSHSGMIALECVSLALNAAEVWGQPSPATSIIISAGCRVIRDTNA